MKQILSLVGIATALLGFGPEAHALEKYQSRTRGAQASYTAYESTDCGYASLSVWGFEEIGSGNQTSYDSVYVDYYSYDFCTGVYEQGYGYVNASTFDIQRLQSASIDGTGTFELSVCDYSNGGGGGEGGMSGGAGGVSGVGGFGGAGAGGMIGGAGGVGGVGGVGGASGMGGDGDGDYEDPCTYTTASLVVSLDWVGTGDTFRERSVYTYSTPSTRYRQTSSGQTREATVTGTVTIDGNDLALTNGYGSLSQTQNGSFEMYR
jgi:hypothetical protein